MGSRIYLIAPFDSLGMEFHWGEQVLGSWIVKRQAVPSWHIKFTELNNTKLPRTLLWAAFLGAVSLIFEALSLKTI